MGRTCEIHALHTVCCPTDWLPVRGAVPAGQPSRRPL